MSTTLNDFTNNTKFNSPDVRVRTETKAKNSYTRTVRVTKSSGATQNEIVAIPINHRDLVRSYKSTIRFNDLKVYDSDGTTLLNIWVDSPNTTWTKIIVDVPNLSVGGRTLYLEYGNTQNSIDTDNNNPRNIFGDALDDLKLWLKASEITEEDGYFSLNDAFYVVNQADKGQFFESTFTTKINTDFENRPAFDFHQSSAFLQEGDVQQQKYLIPNQDFQMIMTLQPSVPSINNYMVCDDSTSFRAIYTSSNRFSFGITGGRATTYTIPSFQTGVIDTWTGIYTVSNTNSQEGVRLRRNGVNVSTSYGSTTGMSTTTNMRIGARNTASSEYAEGRVYEVLVFHQDRASTANNTINDNKLALFEQYLLAKNYTNTNITISVDIDSNITDTATYVSYAPLVDSVSFTQELKETYFGKAESRANVRVLNQLDKCVASGGEAENWSNSTAVDTTKLLGKKCRELTASPSGVTDTLDIRKIEGSENLNDLSSWNIPNDITGDTTIASTDDDYVLIDIYEENGADLSNLINTTLSDIRFTNTANTKQRIFNFVENQNDLGTGRNTLKFKKSTASNPGGGTWTEASERVEVRLFTNSGNHVFHFNNIRLQVDPERLFAIGDTIRLSNHTSSDLGTTWVESKVFEGVITSRNFDGDWEFEVTDRITSIDDFSSFDTFGKVLKKPAYNSIRDCLDNVDLNIVTNDTSKLLRWNASFANVLGDVECPNGYKSGLAKRIEYTSSSSSQMVTSFIGLSDLNLENLPAGNYNLLDGVSGWKVGHKFKYLADLRLESGTIVEETISVQFYDGLLLLGTATSSTLNLTNDWATYELDFTIPDDCNFIVLRLPRRGAGAVFDVANVRIYPNLNTQVDPWGLNFLGTNTYGVVDTPTKVSRSEGTIACWCKFDSTGIVDVVWSVANGNSSNYDGFGFSGAGLEITMGIVFNKIRFSYQCGTRSRSISSATTVTAGTWYHVVCTWNQSGFMRLYVNGNLESSSNISGDTHFNYTPTYFYIGTPTYLPANRYLNGGIADLFVWQRELGSTLVPLYQYKTPSQQEIGLSYWEVFDDSRWQWGDQRSNNTDLGSSVTTFYNTSTSFDRFTPQSNTLYNRLLDVDTTNSTGIDFGFRFQNVVNQVNDHGVNGNIKHFLTQIDSQPIVSASHYSSPLQVFYIGDNAPENVGSYTFFRTDDVQELLSQASFANLGMIYTNPDGRLVINDYINNYLVNDYDVIIPDNQILNYSRLETPESINKIIVAPYLHSRDLVVNFISFDGGSQKVETQTTLTFENSDFGIQFTSPTNTIVPYGEAFRVVYNFVNNALSPSYNNTGVSLVDMKIFDKRLFVTFTNTSGVSKALFTFDARTACSIDLNTRLEGEAYYPLVLPDTDNGIQFKYNNSFNEYANFIEARNLNQRTGKTIEIANNQFMSTPLTISSETYMQGFIEPNSTSPGSIQKNHLSELMTKLASPRVYTLDIEYMGGIELGTKIRFNTPDRVLINATVVALGSYYEGGEYTLSITAVEIGS